MNSVLLSLKKKSILPSLERSVLSDSFKVELSPLGEAGRLDRD